MSSFSASSSSAQVSNLSRVAAICSAVLKPIPFTLASSLTEAPKARSGEPKCFISLVKVVGPTLSALINLSHFSISAELCCFFAILCAILKIEIAAEVYLIITNGQ